MAEEVVYDENELVSERCEVPGCNSSAIYLTQSQSCGMHPEKRGKLEEKISIIILVWTSRSSCLETMTAIPACTSSIEYLLVILVAFLCVFIGMFSGSAQNSAIASEFRHNMGP